MNRGRLVLGIEVEDDLIARWRGYLAPLRQPFRLDWLPADVVATVPHHELRPTDEWQDTFFMYDGVWTWLTEDEFIGLPYRSRRALMRSRRRAVRPKAVPCWPSALTGGDEALISWVESGTVRPSRHREVPAATWRRAEPVLPRAAELAGTFAETSGPNCFGTVRAAVGDGQIGSRDGFGLWLTESTMPVSGTASDAEPGVVFAWTEHGVLAHAAVTLGDGWMLSKPSQAWCSPRLVSTVRDAVNSWRYPGTRLSRHRVAGREPGRRGRTGHR